MNRAEDGRTPAAEWIRLPRLAERAESRRLFGIAWSLLGLQTPAERLEAAAPAAHH